MTFRGRNRLSAVTHVHPSRVKTHYVFEHRLYFSKDAVNKLERQPFNDESVLFYYLGDIPDATVRGNFESTFRE